MMARLERDENPNHDLFARYAINPRPACYGGYNGRLSNFKLVDTEFGAELTATNRPKRNGEQLFVKFSNLFQP